jgi:mannose-6-phosphate isomerase-like protein (cupin superfamily)
VESKRGQSFVGAVESSAKDRGWFFGHFMDEPLLESDLVEVTWQRVPNKTPSPEQRHLHRCSVEINVVLSGTMSVKINDVEHTLGKGDFFVIWPESVVSDVTTSADAEVLVVRAPSVADDKFAVGGLRLSNAAWASVRECHLKTASRHLTFPPEARRPLAHVQGTGRRCPRRH